MSMTPDDYAYEWAMEELHQEAVMARASQEQCIFLFVEGDSEEIAVPILLADVIDLDAFGVKVANYNGHGNLHAALRLLKQTLSHSRPVIVTYDNDPPSITSLHRCKKNGLLTELIYPFSIPADPVVTYACGHRGGSFEESFPVDFFLGTTFREAILPPEACSQRTRFESVFDIEKPWLQQLQSFMASQGLQDWSIRKTALAESLALEVNEVPLTYVTLANLIEEIRKIHPVVHPDDVESPRIKGVNYFPEQRRSAHRINRSGTAARLS